MHRSSVLGIGLLVLAVCSALTSAADYYDLLGVSRSATAQEIKRAYRQQTIKSHPDKNPDDPEAPAKFERLTTAYNVLSDPEKRKIYDAQGEEGLKQAGRPAGGASAGNPFGDMFSSFFNFGQANPGRTNERVGPTVELPLLVTLEELYNGATIRVMQRKQIICPNCHGLGTENPSDVEQCNECGGRGIRLVTRQLAPGMYTRNEMVCDKCGGAGKILRSKCPVCGASKVSTGDEPFNVRVERGMMDGHQLKLDAQGDVSPDEIPGDVIFRIEAQPHRVFVREGDNLRVRVSITLLEALTGFRRTFRHLDGRIVEFSRSDVTPHGFTMRLANEGMPIFNPSEQKTKFGQTILTFEVVFPKHLTTEQKDALKAILVS